MNDNYYEALDAIYTRFLEDAALPSMSADALILEDVTPAQYDFLYGFIEIYHALSARDLFPKMELCK